VLGYGGMGVVVAATHIHLDERVAIKFLRDDVVLDQETMRRFVREAQAAVKLKNEHVAKVTDVGVFDSGTPYMVMELLDGIDLGQMVLEYGKISPDLAVDFVLQACVALADAHSLGIVHRDIKPTNLFVTWRNDGTSLIKVLDFGISKSPVGTDISLTQTQSLLGTPAYMSPEQMRSARTVDPRSDIWSLGTVLFEMVKGKRPFEAESFSEMCVKVAVDPPSPLPTECPPGLEKVILRCLQKAPEDRYGTVADLAEDLAPFARDRAQALVLVGRIARQLERRPFTDRGSNPEMAQLRERRTPQRPSSLGHDVTPIHGTADPGRGKELSSMTPTDLAVGDVTDAEFPYNKTPEAEAAAPPAMDSMIGAMPIPAESTSERTVPYQGSSQAPAGKARRDPHRQPTSGNQGKGMGTDPTMQGSPSQPLPRLPLSGAAAMPPVSPYNLNQSFGQLDTGDGIPRPGARAGAHNTAPHALSDRSRRPDTVESGPIEPPTPEGELAVDTADLRFPSGIITAETTSERSIQNATGHLARHPSMSEDSDDIDTGELNEPTEITDLEEPANSRRHTLVNAAIMERVDADNIETQSGRHTTAAPALTSRHANETTPNLPSEAKRARSVPDTIRNPVGSSDPSKPSWELSTAIVDPLPRSRPWVIVAVALAAGVLVGVLFGMFAHG
jgi:serine/threonine-protein kinase